MTINKMISLRLLCAKTGQKTGPCAADYALGLRPRPNTPGYPSGPESLRTPALVRGGLVVPAALPRGLIAVMLPTTIGPFIVACWLGPRTSPETSERRFGFCVLGPATRPNCTL